jgi:hypothetical protein
MNASSVWGSISVAAIVIASGRYEFGSEPLLITE